MDNESNIQLVRRDDWRSTYEQSLSRLQHWTSHIKQFPISVIEALRVNQLDAIMLDNEISVLLRMQYLKAFDLFRTGWVDTYRAELEASMALIVYFVSIWPSGTTYGNRLQNLIYRTEVDQSTKVTQSKTLSDSLASTIGVRLSNISVKQKIFYGLLHIAVPYVWSRLERVSLNQRWADYPPGNWQRSAFELLSWFEMVWKCLNFINLIVFLYNGRYVSVVDRLLKIRLMYQMKTMSRQVSFEFMNRQLIWTSFSEFVMFLMPLINLEKIKRILSKIFGSKKQNQRDYMNENACPVCSASPINTAFVANRCGHRYCYYCLKTNLMADKSFACLACGQKVISMSRLTLN